MSEKKKFLYAATVSTAMQYSGILRKIAGQTAGMARLGWNASYTCVEENCLLRRTGEQEERFPFPACTRWSEQQKHLANAIGALLEEDPCDMVYIKGFLTNPYHRMIAKAAKQANPSCRVVFEVATYPYWGEYKRFFRVDMQKKNARAFLGHVKEVLQHAGTTLTFSRYVDTVVTFGEQTDSLWGIPAINVDNGVEVDAIPLREDRAPRDSIHLLGVVGTSVVHGYERVLQGMQAYREKENGMPVFFRVVGNNETIVDLKRMAASLGLGDRVEFLGYKNAAELAQLYCESDVGISPLAEYRVGLNRLSPLKSREYLASGLPLFFAYEDSLLTPDLPFVKIFPNDSSPINIEEVVDFVSACRADPELPEKERRFAKEHFDWEIIMKQILDFTG